MNSINRNWNNNFLAVRSGLLEYQAAWKLQEKVHEQVVKGNLPNMLLLLEHRHVYTLGRRGKASDIMVGPQELTARGAKMYFVDRGGEVTYHGPGQLVGYPILDLRSRGIGPVQYVRTLEELLATTLADFGIEAQMSDKPTGGWVGNAKIAAIGVKVSRGVTTHGFALNVNPDLSYFDDIVPCGIQGGVVTSMESVLSQIGRLSGGKG